jgi:hypothetical protein
MMVQMEQVSGRTSSRRRGEHRATARRQAADSRAVALASTIRALMAAGFISRRALADELNRRRIPTALGGSWHHTAVVRILARLGLTTSGDCTSGRTSKRVADVRAEAFRSTIQDLRKAGFVSITAVARELNERGIPTAQGSIWHLTTVSRLLERLDRLDRGSSSQHHAARTGVIVMESNDPAAVARYVGQWNPYMDIELSPVLDDEEAAAVGRQIVADNKA